MGPETLFHGYRALVVTGGSSGIGKTFIEHAYRLNHGLRIINLSRRNPEGDFLALEGVNLRHISCDFTKRDDTERALLELSGELDRPEAVGRFLLINNSGFGTYGAFPEPNLSRNLDMLEVNVRAPVLLTGALLPLLKKRGGAVINVASTAAFQPTAGMAVYGASKAFVLHWSLALSEELSGTDVRVLALCPGPTSTAFFKNAGLSNPIIPDTLGQTSEEVVETCFRALAADRGLVVSGWKNKLGAFAASKLPKRWAARLGAKVIAHFRPAGKLANHG